MLLSSEEPRGPSCSCAGGLGGSLAGRGPTATARGYVPITAPLFDSLPGLCLTARLGVREAGPAFHEKGFQGSRTSPHYVTQKVPRSSSRLMERLVSEAASLANL